MEFIMELGEKTSFLINFHFFLKKKKHKFHLSFSAKTFFEIGIRGSPFDFKLMTCSLKKRMRIFSYSNLKLEDHFRTDLAVFLFLCRKWLNCYQIYSQSLKLPNQKKKFSNFLDFWYCVLILIRTFLEKGLFEISPIVSGEGKKVQNYARKFGFDNWFRKLFFLYKISRNTKELVPGRFFYIAIVKKKFLKISLGSVSGLSKISFSKIFCFEANKERVCEEITRLKKILYLGKNGEFSPKRKQKLVKIQTIQNYDQSLQQLIFLLKIGNF